MLRASKTLGHLARARLTPLTLRRCLSTEPLLQNPDYYRVLRISNLPSGIPVSTLLDHIRVDGPIESIRYDEKDNSATLSLMDNQAAKSLLKETVNINGQSLSFEYAPPSLQRKLSASLVGSIGGFFASRLIQLDLREGASEEWYSDEVQKLCGPIQIERITLDKADSKATIHFTDLLDAIKAKQTFMDNGTPANKIHCLKDPCDINTGEDVSEKFSVLVKGADPKFQSVAEATGGLLNNLPLSGVFKSAPKNAMIIDFIKSSDAQRFIDSFSHPEWSVEFDPRPRNVQTYKIQLINRLGATRRLLLTGPTDQVRNFTSRTKIARHSAQRLHQRDEDQSAAVIVFSGINYSMRSMHPLNYDKRLWKAYPALSITYAAEPQPEASKIFEQESTDLLLPWTAPSS